MDRITVWTKQHHSVLAELERTGRYAAKRAYVSFDLEEHADLVLEVYDWLVKHSPDAANRPADAELPVWVSYSREGAMLPSEGMVLLSLSLAPQIITPINIAKWGTMLNYSYIPLDAQDAARHQALLDDYRTSDAQAYMSRFYPQIKREITDSWSRLFQRNISMGAPAEYGTIWEVHREWITQIIR